MNFGNGKGRICNSSLTVQSQETLLLLTELNIGEGHVDI